MFGLPFHHIGIACADMEKAAAFVQRSFVIKSDSGSIFDPEQNATVRLFNQGDPGAIELVSGFAVAGFVNQKSTYYHVCYLVTDLEATILSIRRPGITLVSRPKKAILFGNRRVAFVHTPLGLVEFLEAG